MTAPRAREQRRPPSPPDRRPPRRGTGSSPSIYAASAAGRRVPPVARHGLVRCARALAAAALLALTGALFLPPTAEAQTGTSLVSNVGQSTYTTGGRRQVSQPFSTGSNEDGYTLTGVDVVSASSTGFTAQVCGVDSTNRPTSACWDLMPPGTFAVGTMSFTAPTNTVLGKSTTYTVVVKARTTNTQPPGEIWEGVHANAYAQGWGFQTSSGANDEDAGSAAGWSIGDTGHSVSAGNTLNNNTWIPYSRDLRIAIKGTAAGGGTPTNNPPVFTSSASLSVEENTLTATVVAVDNDTDDDITGYAITGGTDEGFFSDVTSAGVLTFDEAPNFEDPEDSGTDNTYVVTVQATSGTGTREMTATQTITVTVTDADEKSAKPDKPTLAKVTGSSTTLTATWTKPDLNGGPDIAGYDVAYREGTTGLWEDFSYVTSGLTTTITGLTADTSYQARVRTTNDELLSDWSDASDAVSTNAEMSTPTCTLNTGDLWCGVVTVAAISSGGSVAAHGFAGTDGGLDDKTFSVGTNNYTIDGLYVGTAGDLNLDLTGALDAADKGNLELVVGSTAFDLDDATHVSAVNGYLWTGTGLDWSSDTHVTLRMRRAVALSTDATLSGLTVYDGSSNLTLSPSFASGTETYTASAAYDIATVTVTATKNQADATIAWLDASDATLADADAMASGHQVALEAGGNTFKVKVTAEDGTTTKTYTVTVTRATPTCSLNTGDLWCGVVTVGNGAGFDGYVQDSSVGALSDRTFSVGTNNYTIDSVAVQTAGSTPGAIAFTLSSGLTSADRAALVLHLGSTEYEFSDAAESGGKSYIWSNAGLDWSSESFVTLRLRDTPVANNAPVFSPTTATREVEENSAAGTNVGAVIPEATDSDSGDTLTYSMEGTDADSFAFDASTRQITTITGVTYNHEATKNSYSVTVRASDGTASATIAVTIDVTDVNEKSAKPDKPTLAMVTGSSTSLTATWTKPDLNGGPDIAGYDLQYRVGTTGTWEDFAHSDTAVTTTVTGLTADTSYQVQVRAKNGETDSDWSDPSDAVKTNAAAFTCTDNDIDLVRGMDRSEGSVQICHDNEQRSVCDDSFDQSPATEVANGWAFAGVVCRQLGYATGAATAGSHFGDIFPARYWLDEVVCDGSEANLGACTHAGWGVSDCRFPERAGVKCTVAATGLAATGGDGEVDLAWDAPGADPGITRHEYRNRKTGGAYPAAWTPVPDSAADETNEASYTVTGLAAGTEYDFELRIVGGANASDADEATARTTGVAAPTNFTATAGDAQVMLSWDAPATGSGVTKHQYRQKTTGSYPATWTDIPNSAEDGANEASHTVTGLTNDRAYTFELRAVKDGTNSDPAEAGPVTPTAMTTPTCTPNPGDLWCGVVTVGLHTVGGFQVGYGYADASVSTNTSDTGVLSDRTFSVGTNNYTIDQVVVGSGANAGAFLLRLNSALTAADLAALVLHVDGGSASFAFSDAIGPILNPTYQWNGTGLDWTSETSVTLRLRLAPEAPGKPTNLMAEADGGTRIALSWDAPADDGGSAITGYRIEVSDDAGSNWEDLVDDTGNDDTTYTHEGLSPGDTRHYRVSAINAEGASVASDVADATTAAATTCTLNPGDLWCGVVTVEQFVLGVLALDGFGEGEGGLSETEFTYGTNSYTIDIAANEGTNRILLFSLTSALTAGDRAALELHVDGNGASFAFSAATYNSSAHNYTWTGTGLDWFGTSTVTLRLRAATETDATLRALRVTHSDGSVRLSPAFAPETEEYRASVANPVDEVTVAATANVAAAEVAYLDASDTAIPDTDTMTPGREVDLEVGATVVEVKVTAEDGTTMRTYRVTVTRRAVDAPGREGEFRLAPETEDDYVDEDNDRHGGTAGRVEVYHAGAWGTVCSDGIRYSSFSTFDHDPATGALIMDPDGNPAETEYDNEAAALICKAMDYDDGEYAPGFGQSGVENPPYAYYPVGSSYPADGPKPIWLDDLTCVAGSGFVPSADPLPGVMSHCSYAGWGLHNCTHKEDAGVRCWNNDAAGPGIKSLKGRFVSPPERHDGTNRVKVRVAFSEPVEESPENVGAHGVEVEGGEVTSVSPVGGDARDGAGTRSAGGRNAGGEDREVVWEFEIEPDSDGDLTVTLEAGRPCGEPGAICTADGRALSEGISTTVEGPEAPPPLTASFGNMPEAHDGAGAFRFRVAFSENIGISYRSLREDAFAVSGGRVTRGKRVDDRRDLFEMTVEPDGDGEVTVTLPAGRECSVSGAICTKGENRRQLTNAPTATVAGPAVETGPAGLTARFVDMPSEHDGETAFKFRIAFSEEIRMSGRRLRSDVVAVSGGRATKAGRVNRPKDLWKLKVRPDSLADVTVTLSSGAACDTPGAVCTADGRALSNTISATVEGPVAVSVADARAREGEDETIDFAVSLSRAASGRVSVSYATADGTARAGSDYTRASGKLRFAPGETEKTISVPVLDDAHDEGAETFTLRLLAASGAAIADGVATGTIENTDHMPAAWLARFGRTVTDQVLEAVEARLSAPRAAGARATLAGQALPSWDGGGKTAASDNVSDRTLAARDREAMAAIRDWMAHAGAADEGRRASGEGPESAGRVQWRPLTGRDFVTGTSFALTGGSAEAGGFVSLWGRGAISRFDGREGDLTLDGEVTTGLMGADWAADPGSGSGAGRWTAGLATGHARGTGSYREGGGCDGERCAGEVEARLTGVWPYAGLELTDRLSAWAATGYGAGELKLTPGGETDGPLTADLTMTMGAAGMRGELLTPPEEGGLALAVKGDARFTRTASKAARDANGGKLEAAMADVWLVRTGVEGSRRFALAGGASLTPSLEVGIRLDGGDAETGFGTDLGGGLALAAPKQGVALDLKARGLIAHEARGFREWGASASLTWDPRPGTDRGLALTLRQSWGGSPTGGMDALLGRETLGGLAANDNTGTASAGRLEAELGYGIAMFGGGFTGTPYLGFGLTGGGRDYRLGWRLHSAERGDRGLALDLEATRREPAEGNAEHGVMLLASIRW